MTNISFKIRLYEVRKYKNGKHPIVLQTIFRNSNDSSPKVRRKHLGIAAHKDQWDKNRFRTSASRGREFNRTLDEIEDKAWEVYDKHFLGRTFKYKDFSGLLDQKKKRIDLKVLMEEIYTELTLQGRIGTAMSYQNAVDSIYNFYGEGVLLLTDIDATLLREYEKHNLRKGNKSNVYLRSLKTLFGRAVERGYIEANEMPFKTKYQPRGYCFAHLHKVISKKQRTQRIRTLSIEEMSMVLSYKPSNEAYQRAMDYFLFSYYNMGVDLKDIALMRMRDIKDGLWYHRRQKSGVAVQGKPILDSSMEIIKRYFQKENKFIFNDILGDQYSFSEEAIKCRIRDVCSNLRRRYKFISAEIGLDGYFTINTARHTSATICKQMGGDIKAISSLLNHKSIQTTNNYIGDPRTDQMRSTLKRLQLLKNNRLD